MTMNLSDIISATEAMLTLAKRAAVSDDIDARRAELLQRFDAMATDLGKIALRFKPTDWENVQLQVAIHALHTEAIHADERRSGTFAHLGSETAVLTNLCRLAAVLGYTLEDAATAPVDEPEDIAARIHAEGHQMEAAE